MVDERLAFGQLGIELLDANRDFFKPNFFCCGCSAMAGDDCIAFIDHDRFENSLVSNTFQESLVNIVSIAIYLHIERMRLEIARVPSFNRGDISVHHQHRLDNDKYKIPTLLCDSRVDPSRLQGQISRFAGVIICDCLPKHHMISSYDESASVMTKRADGDGASIPSLDSTFSQTEVSMDLTMCGLLVERAEEMASLYAATRDWTSVEDTWFKERRDGRSTRGSSRKIYRVLSSRFKTADRSLPAISQLPDVFNRCKNQREKAQILYFYLIQDDPLVKYTVHQYVKSLQRSGINGLDFSQETVNQLLNEFHYNDGTKFDYAESTTRRWGRGFRSVMREIGVLETQQTLQGQIPNLGTIPLLVASGFSWETHGKDWLLQPLGWLYLFQAEQYWESLIERLSEHPSWEASGIHGELRLQPAGDTYEWAETTEGEV